MSFRQITVAACLLVPSAAFMRAQSGVGAPNTPAGRTHADTVQHDTTKRDTTPSDTATKPAKDTSPAQPSGKP